MRQFMLLSVAVLFLSYHTLQATEVMAKNTGMRCNQCHKGRNILPGVMPKLKSKGIRHLTKLITVKGYVPKYNYSKLNYLAAQIEANRKKLEAPKKSKSEGSTGEDKSAISAEPGTDKMNGSNLSNKSSKSNKEANEVQQRSNASEKVAIAGTRADESRVAPSAFEKTVIRKKEQSAKKPGKSLNKTQNVVTNSEGKVKFKGGKTFILKRPKVKPGTKYDWEQDWSFDDYY